MCVNIVKLESGKLGVKSEYNKDFISSAKKLGGRWASPYWTFDPRDEQRVRDLCVEVYGTDGAPTPTCTVHVTVTGRDWREQLGSLTACGRVVARAFGRDSGAKLGEGVVLLTGSAYSTGSAKYWVTAAKQGTVFELKDVPLTLAQKEEKESSDDDITVTIVDSVDNKRTALEARRDALLKELAEIKDELGRLVHEEAH